MRKISWVVEWCFAAQRDTVRVAPALPQFTLGLESGSIENHALADAAAKEKMRHRVPHFGIGKGITLGAEVRRPVTCSLLVASEASGLVIVTLVCLRVGKHCVLTCE